MTFEKEIEDIYFLFFLKNTTMPFEAPDNIADTSYDELAQRMKQDFGIDVTNAPSFSGKKMRTVYNVFGNITWIGVHIQSARWK